MQAACSVRAHVVLLADLDAVVAQEGVDGGDVKEKLRQSIVGKIGLAADFFSLGVPGRKTISRSSLPSNFVYSNICM